MNKKKQIAIYLLFDYIAAITAWLIFYYLRKYYIEIPILGNNLSFNPNSKLFLGLFFVPLFWLLLYYFSGFYDNVFRKEFFNTISNTFIVILVGSLGLFFILILDDIVYNYMDYYKSFLLLFSTQFLSTFILRIIITNNIKAKINKQKLQFNTLIIGNGNEAFDIYTELNLNKKLHGNVFIGYCKVVSSKTDFLEKEIPCLGHISELPQILKQKAINEIIIAIDTHEHPFIEEITNWLGFTHVPVMAIPTLNNLIRGHIQLWGIYGTPLIYVNNNLMPPWQVKLKKVIDILFSLIAIVISTPLWIICYIGIKTTSKGAVLYCQERIGKYGIPFMLYKFRSMYIDAEKDGPNLSSKNDKRMTKFGKFMRNTKIDELPNFINVLSGSMSLVGPRPERQYFINKIITVAPNYIQLQKVKPGITSLGQVKYGYAENVEQMTKRLRFDLLYLQNMSLYMDFKIIFYTFLLIIKGRHY